MNNGWEGTGPLDFEQKMATIENALRGAGYDPLSQLVGYYQTGNPTYITRKDDARALIQTVDREWLGEYIDRIEQK